MHRGHTPSYLGSPLAAFVGRPPELTRYRTPIAVCTSPVRAHSPVPGSSVRPVAIRPMSSCGSSAEFALVDFSGEAGINYDY